MPESQHPPFWINPRSALQAGERSRAFWELAESLWPFTLQYCGNVLGDTRSQLRFLNRRLIAWRGANKNAKFMNRQPISGGRLFTRSAGSWPGVADCNNLELLRNTFR